jgi:hypothetical protein
LGPLAQEVNLNDIDAYHLPHRQKKADKIV